MPPSARLRAFAILAGVATTMLLSGTAAAADATPSLLDQSAGTVIFGNGVSGQRLPTVSTSFAATYRTGQGSAGNVVTTFTFRPARACPVLGC